MRALLADHDAAQLESTVSELEGVTLELITSKAQCIDLMRPRPFDLLIACERLVDGSGLELLSQVRERWPRTRRVFAAEPSRLALLKGRLKPFKLDRILRYPIDPTQLRVLLNLT